MNDLELLIEKSLTDNARQKLKIYGPDHIEQLLEDMRGLGRIAEAMNYICQHHPVVFEDAYKKVLKNDDR